MAAPQELLSYITTQRAARFSDDQIRKNLNANGWSKEATEQAFIELSSASAHQADPDQPAPVLSEGAATTATPVLGDEVPGVMQLLKKSWSVYREKLQTILLIQLIPALASFIFGLLIAVGISGSQASGINEFIVLILGGRVLLLVGSVVLIVVVLWTYAALLAALLSEEKLTLSQALSGAQKYILPLFVLGFLLSTITLGALFFLLIPGIIVSIWFVFSYLVVLSENKHGLQALVASRRYVSGKWWLVFGRLFFGTLALMFILMIGILPFIFFGEETADTVSSLAEMFIITPLITIYLVQLYKELKARKGVIDIVVTSRQRWAYSALSVLGIILIPVIIFVSVAVVNMLPAEWRSEGQVQEELQESLLESNGERQLPLVPLSFDEVE
jgi:hypothetical protein